jgi:hypothetical protein
MNATTTTTRTLTAACANAAILIRHAISELRAAGKTELGNDPFSAVMHDLERIHGVVLAGATADRLPKAATATATNKVTTVPAPVVQQATPKAAKVDNIPLVRMRDDVPAPLAPKAATVAVAAATAKDGAVAPKAETAKPKTDRLADYRALQAKAKSLGLSAKGKADQLKATIAKAEQTKAAPKADANTSKPGAVRVFKQVSITVDSDKADILTQLSKLSVDMLAQLVALAK